ncbi:MAG: tRNA uridine-5-carboxymethylaminomethyl(34) synthesis GTPase MnmE, partial [candidate division Zixibacteria bacterium]|nr:tRNA uridine-5-carboxymethylaminomethyl(34) synthesis GTPase MnmE [candidate division Zixibacteria bacterium]
TNWEKNHIYNMARNIRESSYELDDTIAAISTPLGEGGIGIVRISGKDALKVADKIFRGKLPPSQMLSHTVNYGEIINSFRTNLQDELQTREVIDEVLLTVFRAPKSYTAENLVEISCHGGYLVLSKVLEQAVNCGARLAQPGEFTLRAFVNGRIDLSRAEAVAEVIRAKTDLGLKLALKHLKGDLSKRINSYRDKLIDILARLEVEIDFPEEDIEPLDKKEAVREMESIEKDLESLLATYHDGKILREGASVVIIGKPNVGKSSLLNALLKEDRAIVTPIPGTTRDIISEYANLKGIPVRLVDTAGYRISEDKIELEGLRRTKIEMSEADIILLVIDTSLEVEADELELARQIKNSKCLIILNKIDIGSDDLVKKNEEKFRDKSKVRVSALKGDGIENLKEMVVSCALTLKKDQTQGVILSSLRHKDALTRAKRSLSLVKDSLHKNLSPEFVALDLKTALDAIGEVIGKTVTEDILNKIFSEFCIGK